VKNLLLLDVRNEGKEDNTETSLNAGTRQTDKSGSRRGFEVVRLMITPAGRGADRS
jgi:hypothetical protein